MARVKTKNFGELSPSPTNPASGDYSSWNAGTNSTWSDYIFHKLMYWPWNYGPYVQYGAGIPAIPLISPASSGLYNAGNVAINIYQDGFFHSINEVFYGSNGGYGLNRSIGPISITAPLNHYNTYIVPLMKRYDLAESQYNLSVLLKTSMDALNNEKAIGSSSTDLDMSYQNLQSIIESNRKAKDVLTYELDALKNKANQYASMLSEVETLKATNSTILNDNINKLMDLKNSLVTIQLGM